MLPGQGFRKATSFAIFLVMICLVAPIAARGQNSSPASTDPAAADNGAAENELACLVQEVERAGGAKSGSAASNDAGVPGLVPYTRGFNASLVLTAQHDSSDGWAQLAEPDLAYRFNNHFALNLNIPVYGSVNVESTQVTNKKATKTTPATTSVLQRQVFLLGDLDLEGSFESTSHSIDYALTASLGMPTGDDLDGLGAGQLTYSFVNHFQRQFFDFLTPQIELGIGDTPNLNDTRAQKDYEAVGMDAHFQAGIGAYLPLGMDFTAVAFEELPLSTQTVTSTTTNGKKGKQLRTITTMTSKSIGEDNGFLTSLDIPVGRYVTVSGFYNRSLRLKTDEAGASLTFQLRGAPREAETAY
jgi:hypothetical protein